MSLYRPEHKFEHFENSVSGSWDPSFDVHENENEIIVNAELPGITKEQINVDVRKNALVISGKTKRDEKYEEGNVHIQEHSYGSFTRAISLPRNVKTSDITAKFEQGILEVKLPKDENEVSSDRKIDIQ
ncbi:15867_t:CDS:2 [Dentiscutata erythropus]|uniref:15867_t:CDS:1 n=1 Tax=Dentiscutata erythropus TaxID=1348616 RepID=A0A9N9FWS4_9GLOM|nr:15867_t:CDS:2 [Dentiscutata erythropus]